MITDGAYAGDENTKLAAEKNITLITTDMPGKETPEIFAEFELNEDETQVLKCPMGHSPKTNSYISGTGTCCASFARNLCENCPRKDECRPKIHKKEAKVRVTGKQVRRAALQKEMRSDRYKQYARLRNGVETIPSILRNVYHADRMRAKGKIRSKFFFGSKIAALNFRKLLGYLKGTGNYAPNPLLSTDC